MTKRQSFFTCYMANIWTPTKIVQTKSRFSIGKVLVLCLFLMSLLLTPFILFNNQTKQLADYIPHVESVVNKEAMTHIQTLQLTKGKKTGPSFSVKTKDGLVESVNHEVTRKQLKGNRMVFGPESIYLSDENHCTMVISYPMTQRHFTGDKVSFMKEINQLWQQQNQLSLKFIFLVSAASIILTIFMLVGAVATLGLYFVLKKVKAHSPVKEAINLTLLCAGLPTVVSVLCAFIAKDAMVGLQLQLSLWVLMIVFVFSKVLCPTLNIGHELKEMVWRGEK